MTPTQPPKVVKLGDQQVKVDSPGAGLVKHKLTRGRESHAIWKALKERRTQSAFTEQDLAINGRSRDVELF